jgi:hypothetical protein
MCPKTVNKKLSNYSLMSRSWSNHKLVYLSPVLYLRIIESSFPLLDELEGILFLTTVDTINDWGKSKNDE